MRSISRSALLGFFILPAAGVWAADDLDVTIRVIDRQEARTEGFNRIELPRELAPPAATRVRAELSGESRQEARAPREVSDSGYRRDFRESSESQRQQFADRKETTRESAREALIEARERTREWQDTRELRDSAFRDRRRH